LSRDSPDDFRTGVNIDAFPASLQTQSRGAGRYRHLGQPSKTRLFSVSAHRCSSTAVGAGAEPVQGFLAGLTLEAMAAPRPLDEVAPVMPFCFRLPAGLVAESVARETVLLTGPISELVTESTSDDGRSMADESEPWAVPVEAAAFTSIFMPSGVRNSQSAPSMRPPGFMAQPKKLCDLYGLRCLAVRLRRSTAAL
jgi:hypothetical protein